MHAWMGLFTTSWAADAHTTQDAGMQPSCITVYHKQLNQEL
jgi:hypothetical protein